MRVPDAQRQREDDLMRRGDDVAAACVTCATRLRLRRRCRIYVDAEAVAECRC